MNYHLSKIFILVVIICQTTTNKVYAGTTPAPTGASTTGKINLIGGKIVAKKNSSGSTVAGKSTTVITTTLSSAQKLVNAIQTDSKSFQSLEDFIDGKTSAPAKAASARPSTNPSPKKQINLAAAASQAKAVKKQAKKYEELSEVEKLNLMNSPSAPKSNNAPAAQSIPASSGSSSSSRSRSNNGKIIGSAVGGGLAGVALIVGTVFAVVHAKKKRKNKDEESAPVTELTDENEYGGIEEDIE